MTNIAVAGTHVRNASYGSMSRDRRWAMRWSYFFLVLFAAVGFLSPANRGSIMIGELVNLIECL